MVLDYTNGGEIIHLINIYSLNPYNYLPLLRSEIPFIKVIAYILKHSQIALGKCAKE